MAERRVPTRQQLYEFIKNPETIRAFEELFKQANIEAPDVSEEILTQLETLLDQVNNLEDEVDNLELVVNANAGVTVRTPNTSKLEARINAIEAYLGIQ